MEILRCKHCGNILVKLYDSGAKVVCCNEEMGVPHANTTDAAQEKHVPALSLEGDTLTVQIGEVAHPMTAEHYIQMILVEQEGKVQYTKLTPEQEPKAVFKICGKTPFTVYEYCNLHGLWKAEK